MKSGLLLSLLIFGVFFLCAYDGEIGGEELGVADGMGNEQDVMGKEREGAADCDDGGAIDLRSLNRDRTEVGLSTVVEG